MKKIIFLLILILPIFFSFSEENYFIVHLPDGTEIKIEEDKAYYRCKDKEQLLPDGRYLLADGSKLTIKKSKIIECTYKK
jgi:hypothetical protein